MLAVHLRERAVRTVRVGLRLGLRLRRQVRRGRRRLRDSGLRQGPLQVPFHSYSNSRILSINVCAKEPIT